MGSVDGSIIATIIATHMPANIRTDSSHAPIGIHAIDMVQPPGMRMPPDIVELKYQVTAAAPRNTSPETAYTQSSRRCAACSVTEGDCAAMASGGSGSSQRVIAGQAFFGVLDDRHRAVRRRAVELDGAGGAQHLGGHDLGM